MTKGPVIYRVALCWLSLMAAAFACSSAAGEAPEAWRFSFAPKPAGSGWVHLATAEPFSEELGYGFERWRGEGEPSRDDGSRESAAGLRLPGPAVFSIAVPEGNWRVKIDLVGGSQPQRIAVKSETRRLMLDDLWVGPGEAKSCQFIANTRLPSLGHEEKVSLKPRELGVWHWDGKLQIEINARGVELTAIEVTRADVPIIFLAGDSTVTDQPEEPWIGWGQMLPLFFEPSVAIANHAESGLALSSFYASRRLEKVLELARPGDFLLIQFGHNDMKESGEGIGPWQSYSDYLRKFVVAFREKGGKPVLVTSMKRRRFDAQGRQYASLQDYPMAMRSVAAELEVPLVDLNYMSAALYAALGPEDSKQLFVHYAAGTFPGQEMELKDDTHFNAYGGHQLARCVVEGLRLAIPELAAHLRGDLPPFDAGQPERREELHLPPSLMPAFGRSPDGS